MTTFLLDANVLIALVADEHVHHERANLWARSVASFAVCSVVEGAFIRFAVRLGTGARQAQRMLALVRQRRGYEFWPDAPSYLDMDLDGVRGHRQVTDAYLAGLTRRHEGAQLATLDEGLRVAHSDVAFLVPEP